MITHPSDQPGSTLRARMIEDMTVRGFTAKTQHAACPSKTFVIAESDSPISRIQDRATVALRVARHASSS
jgi:hypothetical protein